MPIDVTVDAERGASYGVVARGGGLTAHRVTSKDQVVFLMGLAKEFHSESRFSHIPFSEEKFLRTYVTALSRPDNEASFYVCLDGAAVGVIGVTVGDYFLGNGGRMATTYVVYVSANVRKSLLGGKIGIKLMRLAADWSVANGANELHVLATSGIEPKHSDRFLRKLGFRPYGGNYVSKI